MITLAKYLDSLHLNGDCYINESDTSVSISNISYENTAKVIIHLECLSLDYAVADSEGSQWEKTELGPELQPFRITFNKPPADYECIRILTLEGFRQHLISKCEQSRWEISYLEKSFTTRSRAFTPWHEKSQFTPQVYKKSPRSIIRDHSSTAVVPADISPWLLETSDLEFDNPAFLIWADKSIQKLISTLPSEIDETGVTLKFNGPPRLNLSSPSSDNGNYRELTKDSFLELQSAVSWVFENDREAEAKQILLSAEIARSSNREEAAIPCIREHMSAAFSGAKIAYALAISEISKDTLKSLTDLRKAVTEETAKLTDATRQVVTAVAGTFAVGLGLLAAKATTPAQSWLLITLAIVAALYVAAVIFSGLHFLFLQKKLREEWHNRLYRFLPTEEYRRMVTTPTESTEKLFYGTAILGAGIILALTITVIIYSPVESSAPPKGQKVEIANRDRPQI